VLSLIILVTVVGNIMVIISVLRFSTHTSVSNYFIVSLAVADLTVCKPLIHGRMNYEDTET
jgi:hypothetical protein